MKNALVPNRVIVKVGTSTLTHENGEMNLRCFDALARVLSDVQNMGYEVIMVSSGAIAVGASRLRMDGKPEELRYKQAAAAVGQCQLMHLYDKFFGEYGKTVAQILLTGDDVHDPGIKQNLTNTFDTLLELGIIPIVNENDSVSSAEIESTAVLDGTGGSTPAPVHKVFGDNDTLSAVVAELCRASLLILLSDIDGLYESDPRENPNARLIREIRVLDDEVYALAGGAGSNRGTGGMITKLRAAEITMSAGIDMVITNGSKPEGVYDIVGGRAVGTLFAARGGRLRPVETAAESAEPDDEKPEPLG